MSKNCNIENECAICNIKSNNSEDHRLRFGDWMEKNDITVHYYCLLLSTHLPQNGADTGGILGFLLRDIRTEIREAAKRTCCYCGKQHASIQCYDCKEYFHLDCGRLARCMFHFLEDFRSYCNNCAPWDPYLRSIVQKSPKDKVCAICKVCISLNKIGTFIFCPDCKKGFVHWSCMQVYALSAGYYLRCIWCKRPELRDLVRIQGIFVPDRDANWEKENGAYRDFYHIKKRCNMEQCLCEKGREYNSVVWKLRTCVMCGSFSAHIPNCLPQKRISKEIEEFKCMTCLSAEKVHFRQYKDKLCINPNAMNDSVYMKCTKNIEDLLPQDNANVEESADCDKRELSRKPETNDDVIDLCSSISTDDDRFLDEKDKHVSEKFDSKGIECDEVTFQFVGTSDPLKIEAASLAPVDITPVEECAVIPLSVTCDPVVSSETGPMVIEEVISTPANICPTGESAENAIILENCYEFDEHFNCLNACTVRLNLEDERFAGMTIDEISDNGLITAEHVISRSDNVDYFKRLDELIDEYNNRE